MHEYIRETSSWKYDICKCCSYRTFLTCVKCKYCWSCHWGRLERNELLRNKIQPSGNQRVADQVKSKIVAAGTAPLQQQDETKTMDSRHFPQKIIINVFGEEDPDPICNYLSCNHAFSLHINRNNQCKGACRCRHPQNPVIGLRGSI
jgi:hypothetical protein